MIFKCKHVILLSQSWSLQLNWSQGLKEPTWGNVCINIKLLTISWITLTFLIGEGSLFYLRLINGLWRKLKSSLYLADIVFQCHHTPSLMAPFEDISLVTCLSHSFKISRVKIVSFLLWAIMGGAWNPKEPFQLVENSVQLLQQVQLSYIHCKTCNKFDSFYGFIQLLPELLHNLSAQVQWPPARFSNCFYLDNSFYSLSIYMVHFW